VDICGILVIFLLTLLLRLLCSRKSGWRVGVHFHSPPANGKQGPIPEEMSQTLLTNKNQANLD
jgi:hypothetical protein